MDPLTVFPPEIIHHIWHHLDPADLLAARAVAPHWLASISNCPGAWVTDFSHDWTEFLAVKKAVRSWSSKKIRRQTVRNVKDCLFTEFAYYLLYGTGILEMFSPTGESVRTFHQPVTDLHRGDKCLLIGMDKTTKTSEDPKTRHHTIITDFVFNYLDDMLDTEIITSSPNGYSYRQNGEFVFSLGPDIPGAMNIPCDSDAQLHFFTSCAVSVQGFTVKVVRFFDIETKSFTNLKTSASSPRWIPSLDISPGPEDYFGIIVEQRDFNTISVYHKNVALFEDSYPSSFECLFTKDYFVLSLKGAVTAFKLSDFTKQYRLDLHMVAYIKNIKCESWSLLKNTIAVFKRKMPPVHSVECLWENLQWQVYRLSEIRRKSAHEIGSCSSKDDTKLEPKLQLLAVNSICEMLGGWGILEFEFCPGYAFKIQSVESSWRKVVHFRHFDI